MMPWDSLSYLDYLIIGIILTFIFYKYIKSKYDFFKNRRIPYKKPTIPLFGSLLPNILRQKGIADLTLDIYNEFSGYNVAGYFQFTSPVLMVRDPELLKKITVKDFDHFMDHTNILLDDVDPLFAANLVNLKGEKWKHMRALLSPAFTSSKMKAMFPLMKECGVQLVDHLETRIKESCQEMLEVDIKDLFTRYTTDVIATTAFGIKCDSLKNPTNEFYLCGKDIADINGTRFLVFMGYFLFPKLMKLFNVRIFRKKSSDFLINAVHETIEMRMKQGIVRPDMIHLLMQARKGELRDDDDDDTSIKDDNESMKQKNIHHDITDVDIAAQATIFFLAGFDTNSVLLSFASVLLARHPDVQERLQREIDQTLEKYGGNITYDAINSMKYLDMVISETLRMYPPGGFIDRQCVKPYVIPATENMPEIKLNPSDRLLIPVYGLHWDPQYYPDPEKFDPERFSETNKHNIQQFTYFPFGIGPRSCLGNRFALLQDKLAIIFVLSRFSLCMIDKSPEFPVKLSKTSFLIVPEKGFWVGLKRRHKA